ncbi:antitoxin MazE7 [Streptomyces violascens]|uniref:antitoxin MazE7 n=1 Tax=Streptomyces violascens TaxID=67381 RepID=UPI0037AA8A51
MDTRDIADTSRIEVDRKIVERLTALAAGHHLGLTSYLAELAATAEHQAGLDRAAKTFETVMTAPGIRESFEKQKGLGPARLE